MCNPTCDVVRDHLCARTFTPLKCTDWPICRDVRGGNGYCDDPVGKDPPLRTRVQNFRTDALATLGVLSFVMTVLVSVDERVREQVRLLFEPGAVTSIGTRIGETGSAIVDAVQTQSVEHAPLMTFIVVATILLLGMMRS